MNMFGRVAAGVFGKPAGAGQEEDDSEIEALLQQISDARHAGDRRDAMAQLAGLLRDNPAAQHAMGTMGLPVLLSVLQEDRDDGELLKGALEALQLSVALPDGPSGQQQQLQQPEGVPHPALINADLYCRAPDNALLLLGLLRDDDGGPGADFYVKYGALQTLAALLAACPDKLQACVMSSPGTVAPLMELLGSQMEVLRNEALLLLVGLCAGCPAIASLVAFEGGFERLLAICGGEGGPEGGNIVVQDAAELINHLLRGNVANQRLFREMGHINQLPPLLQFTQLPPPQAAAVAAAAGMLGSAGQFLPAAGAAAAAAAANSVVGAAAAAGAALWPVQVSANFLCLLETARLLLAAPHAPQQEQQAQEAQNRRANQDKLGQLGIGLQLTRLAVDGGGAPSAAVRAQAMFCLADLVHGHPQLQEQLAGTTVRPPPAAAAAHPPPPAAGRLPLPPVAAPAAAAAPVPLLQAVLRLALRCPEPSERAGAMAVLQSFCVDNNMGQLALLSTLSPSADPHSVGGQLLGALLCQQPPRPVGTHLPRPGQQGLAPPGPAPQGLALLQQQQQQPAAQLSPVELQLVAGRAAKVLSFLLQHNPAAQSGLLGLQLSEASGDGLLARAVRLLAEAARHTNGKALPACYSVLRLLVAWCSGCSAAVVALLAPPSHLPLLVDLAGGRIAAGDTHSAGLAAVLLGVCLMNAPGSPHLQQQQQQQPGPAAALPGQISFSQLLDIVLNRVGLSQFFGAIDDMRASKAYAAARAAPQLPAHITRSAATAVLEAEAAAAAAGGSAAADGGSSGAWGLLQGALLNAAAAGGSSGGGSGAGAAAAGAAAAAMQDAQPYDQSFTQLVDQVAATVQQLTLNAFSGGGTGSGAAAAPPAAGSVGGIGQQPLPLPGAVGGVPRLQQQEQQQAGAGAAGPGGALAALAAQLQGETAEQKLDSALRTILQLQASSEELRARNRALAEDLIRLSQSKPHSISASNGHTDGGPANGSHPGAAGGAMNGHQQQQHAGADGQSGPASTGAGGLADVESRVAAQLRASRAELELGAVRQQLSAMQARWSQLEADAVAAHVCADEARAAAAKAEADLAALSSAYNGLEGHAFELEEQLRQQQQGAAAAAAAGAAGASEAEVQARIREALEQDRQQRGEAAAEAAVGGEGGAGGRDLAAALAAAAAEGRAAAEAEAGEEMEDLLACLGEEQAKVEVLSQRLAELGEDVEGLLADLAAAAAAEAVEEQQQEEEGAGGASGADELL